MPIDNDMLMSRRVDNQRFGYTDMQALLYNLSIGMGQAPRDPAEQPFVFELPSLRIVPTFATVLNGSEPSGLFDGIDIDWGQVLHGEQRLTMHRPFPPAADLVSSVRVSDVVDKGAAKGAVITVTREAQLAGGEPLFSTDNVIFARANGGFGGASQSKAAPHILPSRAPDIVHISVTRPEQALLYRLNGDRNPLHAQPEFAHRAGFPAPILHGLCSYGIACRAVLVSVCENDPALIKQFDVRMTAPIFPGEMIHTDIWIDGSLVSFRCRIEKRDIILLNNGRCVVEG